MFKTVFRKLFTAVTVFIKYLLRKYGEIGKYLAKITASTVIFTFLMLSFVYSTIFVLDLLGLWQPSGAFGSSSLIVVGHWPHFMVLLGAINPFNYMTLMEAVMFIFIMANFEEVVFRHMIMDGLLMRFMKAPYVIAVIASSILFGLAHFNNAAGGPAYLWLPQVIGAGCAGVWLAYLYTKCGLHLAVFVHALHNFSMFALSRYYREDMSLIKAALMGLGGLFLYAFLLYKYPKFRRIVAYLPAWIYRKVKGKRESAD